MISYFPRGFAQSLSVENNFFCGGYNINRKKNDTFLLSCFSMTKSTIKEKLLYDSSLSEFFSLVRKERKGQKEEGIDSRLGDADTHASHMCQSLF